MSEKAEGAAPLNTALDSSLLPEWHRFEVPEVCQILERLVTSAKKPQREPQ
jgi:hypothetical protein